MRILVVGGTGGTGLEVIRQALDRRIEVTVVVRSPEKLGGLVKKVDITVGSVFDAGVLTRAAAGATAAISTIGAPGGLLGWGATTVYSRTAAALVDGLTAAGLSRLIFCTSAGVEPHDPGEMLLYRLIAKPLFLQRAYDDMTLAETAIRNSNLEWTLVRPGRLSNRPRSNGYRVSPRFRPKGGVSISRADVASFMLDQLTHSEWIRGTPTLTL